MPTLSPIQADTSIEVAKISPPAIIGGLSLFGIEINSIILIATAVYAILLVVHLAFKLYKDVYRFRHDLPDTKKGDL